MDNFTAYQKKLIKLSTVLSDQLIHYYLVMYDNLLDLLAYQGLYNCAAWQNKRIKTPRNSENGFSTNDVDQFRRLIQTELIPEFMQIFYQAYQSTRVEVGTKSDNWTNFFKHPSLTQVFSLIFNVDQEGVGSNPEKICRLGQKIIVYWAPYKDEIQSQDKVHYQAAEKMLDIYTKHKKSPEDIFKDTMLFIYGITQDLNNTVGLSVLITHYGEWSKHPEVSKIFNLFLIHNELRMNPIRHKNYFPHSFYDFKNSGIKIEGGLTSFPRLIMNDPVCKYMGFVRGQVIKIERDNRGRLSEVNQKNLYWRTVDFIEKET